jgi:hypothetical protein
MYGFTEILPGQIFTNVISDPDRNLIIDMLARKIIAENGAEIIGKITFSSGTSGYDNITDRPNLNAWMDNILFDAGQYARQIANQAAGNAQSNAIAAAAAASINSIESARNALAQNLGYASYSDLVAKAQAGKTIIDGGYVRTALIDANAIVTSELVAQRITASMIAALNIVTGKLTVTSGAKIGNFTVENGSLVATGSLDPTIHVQTPDGNRMFFFGKNVKYFSGFANASGAYGTSTILSHILHRGEDGNTGDNNIALALTAQGATGTYASQEAYAKVPRALVANGGVYVGGSLCVFHETMLDENISGPTGADASKLTYCRKFVFQPASDRTVTLPGRDAIINLTRGDLSIGTTGYLWSGKNVGYQSWIELDVIVTRHATAKITVTSPAANTDIVDNDGNVVTGVDLRKGDIVTFCYHNGAWYQKKHNQNS